MKMLVFAYLRTSNKNAKLALDGDSKDRQLKTIRRFCRGKGWKIEQIFYDCSVSGDNGSDLSEREEWSEMMSLMKSNGLKTYVVADQTRFSRSILTAEIMKQDCRESGIAAYDASTGNNLAVSKTENPEIALINNLLQAISEYDKLKTVQRLQSGRRRAKKQGRRIGGNYRYGNKAVAGSVIGAALGALTGNTIGKGRGRIAAIVTGGVIGAIVGGHVGDSMDKADRLQAHQVLETAQTGQKVTWVNPDNGSEYTVTPTRTYQKENGRYCRDFTTWGWIDGFEEKLHGTACRAADGSWRRVG